MERVTRIELALRAWEPPGLSGGSRVVTCGDAGWSLGLRRAAGRTEADAWRKGLAGEQRTGAELERLTGKGWRVLHSVPLPREVDIDHLVIGAGGVLCFNTKHHPRARVWVGDDSVRIGGSSYPYVRKSRAEARRASMALTRACGRSRAPLCPSTRLRPGSVSLVV
ncbi:nuclease-related domain-containing protein [Streptomyces sp. B1866]|uniref:nuclease-related domain-containing protein n=1 Tax=Streptomyces sp. B1866 TaxID=3075431 RepID=UPI002891FFB0|nr:nuclease-related domain-containing protein [Streptomyces sp. B1866]MDT3398389.1 nuclease-related domain-containing protein [Streptomyces sp. B1866]